ncbi:uncharacterized protein PAC_15904 [Phialocephala subalpina]|uniref:Uncharacterized protein n=1 Tax=Phialocephala subalpina TaxID=576137 RepID=A0A1L7XLX1_9HELO|nr:uncharacterized protein PAC_15904 [Phialocephala subalpina]
MDKLRNILHPGRQQDDETLYGSGQTTGKTGGLTGEGSHLSSSTGNTPGLTGSQTAGTTGASGIGNTSTGVPSEASTDQTGRAVGSGTTTGTSGLGGQGSHLSGARDPTSTTTSGLAGNQTSGLGNTSSTTGSRQPGLARDAATTAAATTSGNTGFAHQPGMQHGNGRELGTETVTPAAVGSHHASDTTSSNNYDMPGSWDDTYDRSGMGSRTTSTGLGSTTADARYPSTTQGTGQLGSTTSSSVPAQSTNTSTGSHLGRDAAAIGTAGAVGEGIHHHRENERNIGSGTGATGYLGTTQDTSRIGSNTGYGNTTSSSATGTGNHLGRDAAALGTAGAVGEGIHHHRENEDGLGSARVLGTTTSHSTRLPSGSGIPSTTLGTEHSGYTSTFPDRTLESQQPSSTTGYGSSNTGNTSSGHHLDRDAAVLGTAGAVGGTALHHREDERNLRDQYTAQPGSEYTGTTREMPLGSATGHTGATAEQPLGSSTGYGSAQGNNTTSGYHLGRDAAALGTAGAVGEGIHHHRENECGLGSSGVTSGYNTYGSSSGPHNTDTANLLDPNIGGGASTLEDAHKHHPQHGGGAEAADKHHMGQDAAIGAGGAGAVGLAEHERNKHDNDKTTGFGGSSTTTQPTSTTTSRTDPTLSSTTGKDHHYGRDATIGAGGVGAAGLAAHEYGKHDNERSTGIGNTSTTTNPATSSSRIDPTAPSTSSGKDHHYGRDAAVGAGGVGAAGLAAHEYGKHGNERSTGIGNTSTSTNPATTSSTLRADPTSSSTSTGKDHHYGRDAAVGAGGVGAAGLAGHEYEKHHGDNTTGTSGLSQTSSGTSSLPGPAPNTAGPHSKDWMNKLDPRVVANPTMAQGNPQAESTLSSQKPSAETGGYGAGSNTSGHHYGRDAAVAGGVGAGVAAPLAHENEKRRLERLDNQGTQKPNELGNPSASAITGHPATDSTATNAAQNTGPLGDSAKSKDHHYGRDTAVAGGVGTAAYEAGKHKHDKDLSEAEKAAKKQHKHDEKELKKEHKHDQKQLEKEQKHDEKAARKESKGGLFGFLHRDKNKKYTPEEEQEFDRQEREHNNSHKGRDAALGTAGVGALGAGAYEAEKHHHTGTDTDKPLPYAPGNQGVGTGAGSDNTTTGQKDHHYGRNAALGTGAAGAAGYAVHEHDKTHSTPLSNKPVGEDLGDKLHGAERNRGVTGTSGFPGTEGYGSGVVGSGTTHTTTGATSGSDAYGSGTHVPSEASTDQYGNPIDSGIVASGTGRDYPTGTHVPSQASTDQYGKPVGEGLTSGSSGSQGHHFGRDAALGTGAAGAAGVAAHEHRKHDSGYQPSSTTGYDNKTAASGLTGSTGQYDNTSSGYAGSQGRTGHHTGRDAVDLGGAGAFGEHEYRKHDTTSGQHQPGSNTSSQYDNTGLGYGQQQSGITGTQEYGSSDTSHKGIGPSVGSASGRRRLHKDPPASHPASGSSHVPASGGEAERMMQEGKEDLGRDTGVANTGNEKVNY